MIASWTGRHSRSLALAFSLLVLAGVYALHLLPVGLFPRVDFPRVVVSVDAGDRPVDRMVVEVTRPLERALRGVPDVQLIRSTSSRGNAEISLSFNWGSDMVVALLQVESVVNRETVDLPAGSRFDIRRMDPNVFPVLGLSLTSNTQSLTALHDLATYQLTPELASLDGVAQVEVLGGRQAEFHVLLDPAKLRAMQLIETDVTSALSASNVISAVGRMEDRYRLYLALSDTRIDSIDDIRASVVRSDPNGVVTVGDVADVVMGEAPQWTRVNADGKDAVLVNIKQQRGGNTIAIVASVRQRLASLRSSLPSDVTITPYYDQSELIAAAAGSVRDAIGIGAVLAGIILMLFLRSWRMTLVVSVVLPAVLLSTSLLLHLLGQSLNIMTLGGMAAAVGLVVDDAVVMIEHVARRLVEDETSSRPPVLRYAMEMLRPLAGSSAATVSVFLPLGFLSGVAGAFFKPLALTMAATLALSFLFALLLVPLLTRTVIRPQDAIALEREGPWLGRLQRGCVSTIGSVLKRPLFLAVPLLLIVAAGVFSFLHLGSGFMPRMDEGGFIFDYRAAPGTSLTETDRLLRQVEGIIGQLPEVASYSRRTGIQLGGGLTEANEGDMFIRLKPPPRRHIEQVMADLRQRVESQVPGLTVETAQLMEDLIGDLISNPQPIEVKVFGPDVAQQRVYAQQIAARLKKIPGVVEVFDGTRIAGDAIAIRIDPVRAALDGLTADAVTRQLSLLLDGSVESQVLSGEKVIGIRVWTPPDLRQRIEQINALSLQGPDGRQLPLQRIADISIVRGQAQQDRDNLRDTVALTARLEGRDLGSAMQDVIRSVDGMHLPSAYRVEYGGLYREQQRSFRELLIVFAGALMLLATLLMFLYERIAVVAAILGTALLSMSGVFVGLWLTGSELDLSSMMGLTMVLGIVTEVAVFYFAELDTGAAINAEQLLHAARLRLRPILMTSLIAMLALMPLALGLGAGSEMQRPLAITIIAGLVLAVPLVLLVMPVMFTLLDRRLPGRRERSADT